MELGEGLCKLRKMNFESGPFHQFEQEISAVLDFIYQTQIELAACEWVYIQFFLANKYITYFHWFRFKLLLQQASPLDKQQLIFSIDKILTQISWW